MSAVSPPRGLLLPIDLPAPLVSDHVRPCSTAICAGWHGRSVIGFAGRGDEPIYFVLLYSALAIEPIL